MSAPNFDSRQLGFPLYVREDFYSRVCPECGFWNMESAEVCEDCGADLTGVEPRYDEFDNQLYFEEVQDDLRRFSEDLEFFTVDVASGYYSGVQFDVDWKKDIRGWGCAGDPEELDNDDAHFYFDCCRSEMLRRYQRERRKVAKRLAELADFHGFEEIVCVGRFSNGEAVYERVVKPVEKPKMKKYVAKVGVVVPVGVNA